MIYEMRTYTVKSGELGTVVKNASEVAREVRGDNFGKLEGYWQTEIGPLSTVMHLWSFESLDERSRLRGELANHKPWTEDYLPLILPRLVRQEIRLMNAFLPFKAPETEDNIYEFRYYRTRPGLWKQWTEKFAAVMPAREKYSKNVCAWSVEAGEPNEVCHLWAYRDLNERSQARAAAAADPDWQAFLGETVPLLASASNCLLVPAPHSPLK